MLSFEEKLAVLESFSELERRDVSLGRVNFHYEDSAFDKKTVVYHLHPNGNGYVYAGLLLGYEVDDKGFVNIREYDADDLRAIVAKSIRSLTGNQKQKSVHQKEQDSSGGEQEEHWSGADNQTLILRAADDLWYVYAGEALESAFETYEEAEDYLREEGFERQQQ